MPLDIGAQLGPYRIEALIGTGGMGEVYRAHDARLGRDVALKVISPRLVGDPALRQRFQVEARAASVLNHPSIVTIYDVGENEGTSWIAMEWVDGRTLRQALSAGPLPVRDAWAITRQVAEGLAVAHAKGVVHRDLKPENVMLTVDGRSKILDFGLARQSAARALPTSAWTAETMAGPASAPSLEGAILGTVGYMSPEQAAGRAVDFRSDQFALGVLAYEMLTGRQAFARPSAVESLAATIREDPEPLSSVRPAIPERFERLIAQCLAKTPQGRFSSTRDLAAALEGVGPDLSETTGQPAPSSSPVPRATTSPRAAWRARNVARAAAATAAAVALLVAALAWQWSRVRESAIESLAVLPFENATKSADGDYLGDGLTESLIAQMSRVPSLKVMALGTVSRFKGTRDPQDAGRVLGVGAVLSGSVSRRGDQIVITAELIETATGVRLWGETYDRPFADLLHVQDSLASDITDGLRLRLSREEKGVMELRGTEDPEAYEWFLKGRYLLRHDSEEDDLEARRFFVRAAEKDPKFVEAHLGVAATYARSAGNGYAPPAQAWARAGEEIDKALAIDPGHGMARAARAARRFQWEWDWVAAEREFDEASADPRLYLGPQHQPMAIFYLARGWPDKAIGVVERALKVDPGNSETKRMKANLLAEAGRLDEAAAAYREIVSAEPQDPRPLFGLAELLKRRGDVTGAIMNLRKACELSGEEHGSRALAHARTEKDYDDAQAAVARVQLQDLQAAAKEHYVSPLDLARLYAQVGDRERALATLELALSERSTGLVLLKVDRAWDSVRNDPRFAAAVRRVGIP